MSRFNSPYNKELNDKIGDLSKGIDQQNIKTAIKINKELVSQRKRKPLISIIDDDGRTDILTKWLPLLKTKNFKLNVAVITNFASKEANYLTWEQLEDLKANYNVDLINHSHTHPYHGQLTESELRYQFEQSFNILQKRGHTADVYVYPYGSEGALTRKVAREYCRAAFYTDGGVNTPPMQTFRIKRESLMSSDTPMQDVAHYTAFIDEAIATNGWIVFMTHSQFSGFDVDKVSQIIDYANSKGIEWAYAKEGLDIYGNIVDIGDYTLPITTGRQYTVIDCDGKWHSSIEQTTKVLKDGEVVFDTPVSYFTTNKTTISHIYSGAAATSFPESVGGLLETFRGASDSFSYQFYKPYNNNTLYVRRWDTTNSVWLAFDKIGKSPYTASSSDAYNINSLLTDFSSNTVTVTTITDPNATGFPGGVGGTLETYKLSTVTDFAHQIYKPYTSNKVYKRRWLSGTSTWGSFELVNTRMLDRQTFTVTTTVPANGSIDVSTIDVASSQYSAVAIPHVGLESGILYCTFCDSSKVVIRLFNMTSAPVAVNRPFKIDVIKNT